MVSADLKPGGLEFNATIDVIESLGSDKFVFFSQELGQATNVAELQELARDSGRTDTGGSGETVVARLDPASRVTEGGNSRLWVDARKLHVFDPASGRNLTQMAAQADTTSTAAPAAASPPGGASGAGAAEADARAGEASAAEANARAGEAPPAGDPASGPDSR